MDKQIAANIIALAASLAHLGAMASSAALCLSDAQTCMAAGDYVSAARRGTDSLEYSVGIFHPACHAARKAVRRAV